MHPKNPGTKQLPCASSAAPGQGTSTPTLWRLFSWLNPLPRTVFLFALPSKPIRKCEWLPGQGVQLQGGVGGSLGGWHDGCSAYSAYNPCVYLGEPGPPFLDTFFVWWTIFNFPAGLAPRTC